MPVPAIMTPMSTPAVQPAAARANPMAPATSSPVGATPPQQPNVQPPPVGGVTQPNLPMNPQAAQKMAALQRAEMLSVLYKYGAQIEKKKPSSSKSHAARGAAVGAGVGGTVGLGMGAHAAAAGAKPPTQAIPKVVDKIPTGGISQRIGEARKMIQKLDAHAAGTTAPAVAMPIGARLKQVIKDNGVGKVLAKLGPTAAIAAGLGAAGGAAGGLAYNAYRNRNTGNV